LNVQYFEIFAYSNVKESILVKCGISPLLGYSSLAYLTKLPTVYYMFQSKNCQRESHIGVPYGVQKFYSGSVVKTAGKITLEVYICPETVMSEP